MFKVLFKVSLPVIIFLLGVFTSLSLSPQIANAQACTIPSQVTNVQISYPSCVGDQCNFTQAGCAWNAVSGAANYQVVGTEVDSNTVVYNQQVPATTLSISFAITQNKTYRCDVSAINSCGTGPVGTNSLLCAADAAVTTTPAAPTPTLVAKPTIQPGGITTTIAVASIAAVLLVAGMLLFLI